MHYTVVTPSMPTLFRFSAMKKSYDFSKSTKNPYLSKRKKQLTIRLDEDTIDYFRSLSEDCGVPYQSLINLYLRDCASRKKRLQMKWAK